jgi:hypothetical protein
MGEGLLSPMIVEKKTIKELSYNISMTNITDIERKEMLKKWILELSEVSESISPISENNKSRKEGLLELVKHLEEELKELRYNLCVG